MTETKYNRKKALVFGAGGFIGSHMVNQLRKEGYWVMGVDIKHPEFSPSQANFFWINDLTDPTIYRFFKSYDFDEVYQFAANMGGAGFVFVGRNDFEILTNNVAINVNTVANYGMYPRAKIFFASSACVYPQEIQQDASHVSLVESSAYPANPDSDYGWEKLFSEHLYQALARNKGVKIAIARYHNIFGTEGDYQSERAKAPAALCRKIAQLPEPGGEIEVWGDGKQTRSFLFIDDCIEATRLLMKSDYQEPLNIGSEEMVSIDEMVNMIAKISFKDVRIKHVDGPTGVKARNSENSLIKKVLGWQPKYCLFEGLDILYDWIDRNENIVT